MKALFWMNGGGAVALLAFLQAVWKDDPGLSRYVLTGIACHSLGVLFGGAVQLLRYSASFNFQEGKRNQWLRFRFLYLCAAYASMAAFLVGTSIVVWGAWCTLGLRMPSH